MIVGGELKSIGVLINEDLQMNVGVLFWIILNEGLKF